MEIGKIWRHYQVISGLLEIISENSKCVTLIQKRHAVLVGGDSRFRFEGIQRNRTGRIYYPIPHQDPTCTMQIIAYRVQIAHSSCQIVQWNCCYICLNMQIFCFVFVTKAKSAYIKIKNKNHSMERMMLDMKCLRFQAQKPTGRSYQRKTRVWFMATDSNITNFGLSLLIS